jgi:hypothetical protein
MKKLQSWFWCVLLGCVVGLMGPKAKKPKDKQVVATSVAAHVDLGTAAGPAEAPQDVMTPREFITVLKSLTGAAASEQNPWTVVKNNPSLIRAFEGIDRHLQCECAQGEMSPFVQAMWQFVTNFADMQSVPVSWLKECLLLMNETKGVRFCEPGDAIITAMQEVIIKQLGEQLASNTQQLLVAEEREGQRKKVQQKLQATLKESQQQAASGNQKLEELQERLRQKEEELNATQATLKESQQQAAFDNQRLQQELQQASALQKCAEERATKAEEEVRRLEQQVAQQAPVVELAPTADMREMLSGMEELIRTLEEQINRSSADNGAKLVRQLQQQLERQCLTAGQPQPGQKQAGSVETTKPRWADAGDDDIEHGSR